MNIPPFGDNLKKLNAHLQTLKVVPQTIPNMTVKITPGGYWFNDSSYVDFPGGVTPPITAPQSGAKFVIVGLSKAGTITLIDGQPSANPTLPKLTSNTMPLAAILVRSNTTMITEENIFDIRQVFQSPNFVTSHENISGRDKADAHPISAITGLEEALMEKIDINTLETYLSNKADTNGTKEQEFILNKDETGIPTGRCSFTIGRGIENNVSITWDESLNRWIIDEDVHISDPEKGFLVTSQNGTIYRIVASDNGTIGLLNLETGITSHFGDQFVKADITDPNPGFLSEKIDKSIFEIDTVNHKLKIKNKILDNIGKVQINSNDNPRYLADKIDPDTLEIDTTDTNNYKIKVKNNGKVQVDSNDAEPGFLADKIDNTTLEIDTNNHKIKVKQDVFEAYGSVDEHETVYNHDNIGKVHTDIDDDTPGFLIDKIDTDTLEVDTATHKLKVKSSTFESYGSVRVHEEEYNHDNIGKIQINADDNAGYLIDKIDTNTLDINNENKLTVKGGSVSVHESTYNHNNIGKIQANATDNNPGFLSDKIDNETLEIDSTNNKLKVKDNLFESAGVMNTHEATYDHSIIGKVRLNSGDDSPSYLADKIDANTMEVDLNNNTIKVKANIFEAAGAVSNHESTYNHSHIGKVASDSMDTNPGFLSDKIDNATLEIDTNNHKIKVKNNIFETKGTVSTHESTYNHNNIGKVQVSASDLNPGYLANKIDNNTLVVNTANQTIKVKDGVFESAGAVSNHEAIYNHNNIGKVLLNSGDDSPGYLADKLDANTMEVDLDNNTIKVKTGIFEQAGAVLNHETDYNHDNIGKVLLNSEDDTAGYLADKIDANTLDIDTTNNTIKVKDNIFESAGAVSDHETKYDHDNIGKVQVNDTDLVPGYLADKIDINTLEVNASNKIKVKDNIFEAAGAVSNHESKYNHDNIGKVLLNSDDDTAGYLADKIDTNTLDIDTTNNTIKVKDNVFEPVGAVDSHEKTYDHDNIGKVQLNSGDDSPGYLADKIDANTMEVDLENGVIKVKTVVSHDIEITDSTKGIILTSPNGTRFRITVDDSGNLTATQLT